MCTILFVQTLSAQVLNYDMIERNANTDVKLTLKDSRSSKPISWASVYLVPAGDTTITHFALSDDKGDVLLKEVPVGKYELNAEIIGYNPHKKVYTIKAHWDAYDLGIIKMEENAEFLDAATVSAIGNPVVVKKDTIEFNASSFRVSENAMLEDLIKKMPGMEVSDDGTVTLNGEKIDKITVGGKTFFFNDPTAALKNLPAKIVDKIKVIDKTKDEAAGSGIVTKDDKEKVMDVELKEEYTEGWDDVEAIEQALDKHEWQKSKSLTKDEAKAEWESFLNDINDEEVEIADGGYVTVRFHELVPMNIDEFIYWVEGNSVDEKTWE